MRACFVEPVWQERAVLSPDGRLFAGVVQADRDLAVVVVDVLTRTVFRPFPEGRSWSPAWSPDSSTLACLVSSGSGATVAFWAPGQSPQVVRDLDLELLGFGDDAPQWFPDSQRVLVHSAERSTITDDDDEQFVDVLENNPFRGISPRFVEGDGSTPVLVHVVVDAKTGGMSTLGGGPSGVATLSPDGERMGVQSGVRETPHGDWHEVDVTVLRLDSPGQGALVFGGLPATGNDGRHPTAWSADGAQFALVMPDHVLLVSHDGERRLAAPVKLWTGLAQWTPDARSVIVADQERRLWAVPCDGSAWRPLDAWGLAPVRVENSELFGVTTAPEGCELIQVPLDGNPARSRASLVGNADVTRLGTIWGSVGAAGPACEPLVYASVSPTCPTTYRLRVGGSDEPVDLNPDWRDEGLVVATTSTCHVLANAAPEPHPALRVIYPGALPASEPPTWNTWKGLSVHGAGLVAEGFAFIAANLPAPAFGQSPSAEECAAAVQRAVNDAAGTGLVDPSRVVLAGYSGGGCATSLAATADAPACGFIVAAGPSDDATWWASLCVLSDGSIVLPGRELAGRPMNAAPWDSSWIGTSSFLRADRITKPILLVHGTGDTRIPVAQADALFVALLHRDAPVRYLRYRGGDHSRWPDRSETHLAQEILRFLKEVTAPV